MEKWAAGILWESWKSQGASQVVEVTGDYNFNREGRMHSDPSEIGGDPQSWSALIPAA